MNRLDQTKYPSLERVKLLIRFVHCVLIRNLISHPGSILSDPRPITVQKSSTDENNAKDQEPPPSLPSPPPTPEVRDKCLVLGTENSAITPYLVECIRRESRDTVQVMIGTVRITDEAALIRDTKALFQKEEIRRVKFQGIVIGPSLLEMFCCSRNTLHILLASCSQVLNSRAVIFGIMTDTSQLWTMAQKQVELREIQKAKKGGTTTSSSIGPGSGAASPGQPGTADEPPIVVVKKCFTLEFPWGDRFIADDETPVPASRDLSGTMITPTTPTTHPRDNLSSSPTSDHPHVMMDLTHAVATPFFVQFTDGAAELGTTGVDTSLSLFKPQPLNAATTVGAPTPSPGSGLTPTSTNPYTLTLNNMYETGGYMLNYYLFIKTAKEYDFYPLDFPNLREFWDDQKKIAQDVLEELKLETPLALTSEELEILSLFSTFSFIRI